MGDNADHNAAFVPALLASAIKGRNICEPTSRRGICNVAFFNLFTFSGVWVELGGNIRFESFTAPSSRDCDIHTNRVLGVEANSRRNSCGKAFPLVVT